MLLLVERDIRQASCVLLLGSHLSSQKHFLCRSLRSHSRENLENQEDRKQGGDGNSLLEQAGPIHQHSWVSTPKKLFPL